jgi:hypothetical protein
VPIDSYAQARESKRLVSVGVLVAFVLVIGIAAGLSTVGVGRILIIVITLAVVLFRGFGGLVQLTLVSPDQPQPVTLWLRRASTLQIP